MRDGALERVREGKKTQEEVVFRNAENARNLLHVRDEVAVREHDPLGSSGRTRRIDEAREVVRARTRTELLVRDAIAARKPGFDPRKERRTVKGVDEFVREDHFPEVGKLLARRANGVPAGSRRRYEKAASAVAQDIGGTPRRVDRVKRHGNEGVRERRLIEGHGVEAVREQHRHAIARLEPHRVKGSPPAHDSFVKVVPGG